MLIIVQLLLLLGQIFLLGMVNLFKTLLRSVIESLHYLTLIRPDINFT